MIDYLSILVGIEAVKYKYLQTTPNKMYLITCEHQWYMLSDFSFSGSSKSHTLKSETHRSLFDLKERDDNAACRFLHLK